MLRKAQQALIQTVLNLNTRVSERDRRSSLEWKVLVYDDHVLSILTTLLKVSSLIEVGVTFHDSITKKRSPIPNVSAVYLVEATEANLALIADDCAVPLYDSVYVNFIGSISSPQLEHFAALVAARSDGSCIRGVFDQYLDFSSPDPNFFTLFANDSSFLNIYRFRQSDDAAPRLALEQIGESLVSVFLTAGEVPKIVHRAGSEICGIVANAFREKITPLAANLEFMGSRRGDSPNTRTPLLILFERTCDLAAPLHHPDSYQAVVHDQVGIVRNQCKTDAVLNDLDPDLDVFWAENRMKPFPVVAELIRKRVADFKQRYGEIEADLNAAIANLPDLQHQQRCNMIHTRVSTKVLESASVRKAGDLFKIESDIFLKKRIHVDAIRKLLPDIPDAIDRLRLVTIAYLSDIIPDDQIIGFSELVGRNLTFLSESPPELKIRSRPAPGYLAQLFGGQNDDMAVAVSRPIATMTRELLEGKYDGWHWADGAPLQNRGNVYVFVIGPGSYLEYHGISQLCGKENVTFGCTSVPQPADFMAQFSHIADPPP
jgi:hypothetical protein